MRAWTENQTDGVRHGNANDLIHRDQQRRTAFASLQAAVTEGVESGEAEPFDATAFKRRMRERHIVR